jgi:hypothetical protein
MLPFRFLLPLALFSLVAAPAHATTFVHATFGSATVGGSFIALCDETDSGDTSASAAVSCNDGSNSGQASASALHGSLGTKAWVYSGAAITDNLSYQAYSQARFGDQLSLGEGPIETGVWTDARAIFNLSGFAQKVDAPTWLEFGDMFVDWTFTVTVGGLVLQPSNGPPLPGKDSYYDFDMTPGEPVNFSAMLEANARCYGCDVSYEAIVDFSSTAILSAVLVKDPVSGEFLDLGDFTITSGEGASYANVVPEPTTGALLGFGLICLAVAGRRRSGA